MIHFDSVTKRYGGNRDALRDLSFTIDNGEMVFLTGRSGAGKSTLLKLVALIDRPTRGQVFVAGVNTGRLKRSAVAGFRRRIGVVFQDHKLLADRTVFDNVALPLVIAGSPPREIGKRVRAALEQVGLSRYERALPAALSSGEQQRVGIARAVVGRPNLLIADEPTGNLDPLLSFEIMKLFLRFNEVGVTVVIASHDVQLIRMMGKRVITLDKGQLLSSGTPAARRKANATGGDAR